MPSSRRSQLGFLVTALVAALAGIAATSPPDSFSFVILGDRTGEARPGVYEQVWKDAASENPAFIVSVGDTIQGLNDATAEAEWTEIERTLAPYRRYRLFLVPGNHDIWSEKSESLFRKYAAHAAHYSFDYEQAHFSILDNSRSDELSADELAFLDQDLKAHQARPVKFIVSHRPSWLLNVAFGNSHFALHQLAKKYGVQYVIAGHLHQMFHVDLEGVMYLSMPSSGGHLRASEKYEDGWFFGQTLVEVHGKDVDFRIKELTSPYGQGRVTGLKDWGRAGLVEKSRRAAVPSKSGR